MVSCHGFDGKLHFCIATVNIMRCFNFSVKLSCSLFSVKAMSLFSIKTHCLCGGNSKEKATLVMTNELFESKS